MMNQQKIMPRYAGTVREFRNWLKEWRLFAERRDNRAEAGNSPAGFNTYVRREGV